jgi:hypothetical protein
MPLNFSSQARACLEWIGHPEGLAGSTPDGISPVLFRSISRRDVRSTQALESKQFVGESKRRNTMSILIEGAADKSSIACHDYPAGLKSMRENSVVPPGLESFFLFSPALKCVRENWVVPPGLKSYFPLYPALKRGAKLVRPSGAGVSCTSFHQVARKRVLTHTLKRWANVARPSGTRLSSTAMQTLETLSTTCGGR